MVIPASGGKVAVRIVKPSAFKTIFCPVKNFP
jgi:hypothetical protein